MIDCLYWYSRNGWAIFPVSAKTKTPFANSNGHKDATTDLAKIDAWYKECPNCAWAVATSAERAALDVDPRHNGGKHLAALVGEHGPLPATPRVKTGGGGFHHYLKCPPGTKCRSVAKSDINPKADSITLKADGGYVIIPPSLIDIPEHQGRAYAWEVRPWEATIADAPAWLLTASPKAKDKPKAGGEGQAANPWVVRPADADLLTHQGSLEGERRLRLCQLVGVHLARGDSAASIVAMAEAWAGRCKPAFDEWEKHVGGLLRKEGKNAKADANSFLPSGLPAESAQGEGERGLSTDWPTLPPEAYHGLFGQMLKAVEPETEADSVGVLLGFLAHFGSCVGRGAWFTLGPDAHHPALYIGIVGQTSARKGMGYSVAKWPFAITPA